MKIIWKEILAIVMENGNLFEHTIISTQNVNVIITAHMCVWTFGSKGHGVLKVQKNQMICLPVFCLVRGCCA